MNSLVIVAIMIGIGLIFAAAVMGNKRPKHFTDVDQDGEPDETPAEKRRAREKIED